MLNQLIKELNKDKIFYEFKDNIGLYQKNGLFYFTFRSNLLPLTKVMINNKIYSTTELKTTLKKAVSIQNFINIHLTELILAHVYKNINNLSKMLNENIINNQFDIYEKAASLLYADYNEDNLVDMLIVINDIDIIYEDFYKLMELIAKDSTIPFPDFLDPLILAFKNKISLNGIDTAELFDLFWECMESIKEKGYFKLEFELNNVQKSFNIEDTKSFVKIYLTELL